MAFIFRAIVRMSSSGNEARGFARRLFDVEQIDQRHAKSPGCDDMGLDVIYQLSVDLVLFSYR